MVLLSGDSWFCFSNKKFSGDTWRWNKPQISVGHPAMRIQTEWITIDDHLGPCKVGYIIVIEWYDVLMKYDEILYAILKSI